MNIKKAVQLQWRFFLVASTLFTLLLKRYTKKMSEKESGFIRSVSRLERLASLCKHALTSQKIGLAWADMLAGCGFMVGQTGVRFP